MPFLLSDEEWGITPEIREHGILMPEELRRELQEATIKLITFYLDTLYKDLRAYDRLA